MVFDIDFIIIAICFEHSFIPFNERASVYVCTCSCMYRFHFISFNFFHGYIHCFCLCFNFIVFRCFPFTPYILSIFFHLLHRNRLFSSFAVRTLFNNGVNTNIEFYIQLKCRISYNNMNIGIAGNAIQLQAESQQ